MDKLLRMCEPRSRWIGAGYDPVTGLSTAPTAGGPRQDAAVELFRVDIVGAAFGCVDDSRNPAAAR